MAAAQLFIPPVADAPPLAPGADVLVVALDMVGVREAVPLAAARAAALGGRLTVAGRGEIPLWWAAAACTSLTVPPATVEVRRRWALERLHRHVSRLVAGADHEVVCWPGAVERWLAGVLRGSGYGTVLLAARRVGERRAARLQRVVGSRRTFAVITPLSGARRLPRRPRRA